MNASATANNLFATYWAQQNGSVPPVLRDWLCFTAEADASTVSLGTVGTPSSTPVLQTSSDGVTWTSYTIGSTITLAEQGDKVYFKGDNAVFSTSSNDFYRFAMTGQVSASGNVMSLVDSSCQQTTVSQYMFRALFADCTALTSAPDLPATVVERECYRGMFSGCTSLTEAPELPAMSLINACYQNMFSGCTSLTSAPELPATSLGQSCYVSMFSGCTSLVNPPTELPADSLTYQAYRSMFYGCSAMTHPPRMLATKHGGTFACREMFRNCTSLVEAVVPPALKLGSNCYQYMYRGCSSLTVAPELPATNLATLCYDSIFMDCTGLVTGPSAISVESIPSQACYDMFSGCTHLVNAPALPATTVGASGYRRMFKNCSSLQGPVVIRATSLSTDSLNGMLEGTSSLHEIQVAFTDWGNPLVSTDWVKNTAATGKFICPSTLDTTRSINQVPVGWTVETLDTLPVGFTRIDAVHRSDSYIDTGLLTDSTDEWIITCRRTGTLGNYPIIGGGNTKTDSNMALWLNNQTNLVEFTFGDGGSNAYKVTTTSYNVSEFHTYRMKLSTGEAWLDGDYIGQSASLSSVPNPKKLVLYGCWRGSSNFGSFRGALVEAIIIRDGVEVRHFVPCIRNSDKVTGLFDLCGSSSPSTGTPFYAAAGGFASTPWISYDVTAVVDAVQDALAYGFKITTLEYTASVDWGDGSTDTVAANTTTTVSHTYAEPGSYTVEIDAPYASDLLQLTGGSDYEYRDRLTGITSYKADYVPNSLCRNASRLAFPVDVLRDVTYIGSYAFRGCSSLSWKTLPDNLSQVNDSMCYGCTSLALGALPPGVLSIAQEAFRNCPGVCLGSLPSGVSSIGGAAFQDCTSLHLHELPSGLTYIDSNVFHGCTGLMLTALPSGVTGIGAYAFRGCTGITFKSLPSGLTSIGSSAFFGCTGLKLTSLPSGMTSISSEAFVDCTGLEQMTLPNGITEIGATAFSGCANLILTSLPSALTTINHHAFYNCTKIELPALPSSVTGIGNNAFHGCESLRLASLPAGLTGLLDDGTFSGCTNITIDSVPSGVTGIAFVAFGYCTSITSMTLSEGVLEIQSFAFRSCSHMESVRLPASLTRIGGSAFIYCYDLSDVVIPAGSHLTTIEGEAFRSCRSLKRFTVPASVTSIGNGAFWGADALRHVIVWQDRGALTSNEPWSATNALIAYNDVCRLRNGDIYAWIDDYIVMHIPNSSSGPNLNLGRTPTDGMALDIGFRIRTAGPAVILGAKGQSDQNPAIEIGSGGQDNCLFVAVNGVVTYAQDGSDRLTLSAQDYRSVRVQLSTAYNNGSPAYTVIFHDLDNSKEYSTADVPYTSLAGVTSTMYLCGYNQQESMVGDIGFGTVNVKEQGSDTIALYGAQSTTGTTVNGYIEWEGCSFLPIDTSNGTTVTIDQ